MSRHLGQTKTQAHSLKNRGYKHFAVLPINQARPTLANVDYVATPIRDEGQMLYSFSRPEDFTQFLNDYGGVQLDLPE